jgi:hypothetical protein
MQVVEYRVPEEAPPIPPGRYLQQWHRAMGMRRVRTRALWATVTDTLKRSNCIFVSLLSTSLTLVSIFRFYIKNTYIYIGPTYSVVG